MHETLPTFWLSSTKPFLLKIAYSQPSKIIDIYNFNIYVFVNMTNTIVKGFTLLYMCMEAIICQSERSPEMFIISQTDSIRGHENTWDGNRNVEETLPVLGVGFVKPFLLKIRSFLPSKIVEFWTFHLYLFVNATNIVVINSNTVQYMCIAVIFVNLICLLKCR